MNWTQPGQLSINMNMKRLGAWRRILARIFLKRITLTPTKNLIRRVGCFITMRGIITHGLGGFATIIGIRYNNKKEELALIITINIWDYLTS